MDEIQSEFMNAFCDLIQRELNLEISLYELPADGGLYAESGAPALQCMYMNKSCLWKIPVLFLSKRKDQQQGLKELEQISMHLHYRKNYPDGTRYGWADASIITPANKIGRDEDGQYLHSCIVNCLVCF